MSIILHRSLLKRKEMDAVLTCMISDSMDQGSYRKDFSLGFQGFTGCDSSFVFREYAKAITFCLESLNLKEGNRVAISPLADGIYLQALKELKIIPVFPDVEAESPLVAIDSLKQYTDQIQAVIVPSTLGHLPPLEELSKLGLPIILDLSQGVPFPKEEGEGILPRPAAVIMAFEQDSILHTGGGAAAGFYGTPENRENTVNNPERFSQRQLMSDFNAAMGISQWEDLKNHMQRRKELYQLFTRSVMKSHHSHFMHDVHDSFFPYSFPVLLTGNMQEVSRYALKKNVNTAPAFSEALINFYPEQQESCPQARSLILRTLLFPLYPSLKREEIDTISRVLSTIP